MTDPLAELSRHGVSIWLDDLSRMRLVDGSLADLVAHDHVVGVTTNPAIFAKAISGSDASRPSSAAAGPSTRPGSPTPAWPWRSSSANPRPPSGDVGGATIEGAQVLRPPAGGWRVAGMAAAGRAGLAIC
jgi:Transaldolase/Fructose-6-phosphate aldolase